MALLELIFLSLENAFLQIQIYYESQLLEALHMIHTPILIFPLRMFVRKMVQSNFR